MRLALAIAVSTLLHVAVPATLIARTLYGDLPEPFVTRIICVFPLPALGQFTRAVMASPGTIRPVEQLDQAEVVVQFTDYSRKLTKEGEPQQRWGGHFKIVGSRLPERSRRAGAPESFGIVATGPDEWGRRAAVAKVGDILAKALGRQRPRAAPEPI